MKFSDQIPVDPEYINQKWRRRSLKEKYQNKSKENQINPEIFEDEDIEVVKELYHTFKQFGIKMP